MFNTAVGLVAVLLIFGAGFRFGIWFAIDTNCLASRLRDIVEKESGKAYKAGYEYGFSAGAASNEFLSQQGMKMKIDKEIWDHVKKSLTPEALAKIPSVEVETGEE